MRRRQPIPELERLLTPYFAATPAISAESRRQFTSKFTCWAQAMRRDAPATPWWQQTTTTAWVRPWQTRMRYAPTTITHYLSALNGWWQWLFETGYLEGNVLAFIAPKAYVTGDMPVLTLPPQCHRHVEIFLQSQRWNSNTVADYRGYLRGLIQAVAVRYAKAPGPMAEVLDVTVIRTWVHSFPSEVTGSTNYQRLLLAEKFCEYLCHTGALATNPVRHLLAQYPRRGRAGMLRALLAPAPEEALQRLRPPVYFTSGFAAHAQAFLAVKRAMGCRYQDNEARLADFDRYLAQTVPASDTCLTPDVIHRYFQRSGAPLPQTVSLLRQYSLYLYRHGCLSALPDWTWLKTRTPTRLPAALTPDQVRHLLLAVETLGDCTCAPLRVLTLKTLFLTLFGAGLRMNEALHLTVQDVDGAHDLLTIRQTKFGKTRLVPVHASLAYRLRVYAEQRDRLFGPADSASPFFQYAPGTGYRDATVQKTFAHLRRQLGWNEGAPTGRPPTPHALRHGFAHARLLQWYQAGEEVPSKLPLLSTYMGHTGLTGTQVYLQGTQAVHAVAMDRFAAFGGALLTPEPKGDAHEDE
ncbi:MAG: tyrosine-type recombinase/integrase [Kiritimatiellia bacterium]|jgi:integrase